MATEHTKPRRTSRSIQALALAGAVAALAVALPACVAGRQGATAGSAATGAAAEPASQEGSPGQRSAATQTSEGGQVTVKVTWPGPNAGPVFAVALDTHAVDLDGYDLRQLAVLRTDQGREARPSGWDAPKGGHHRQGTLTFPAAAAGIPLISPTTRSVELVIRDVAGVRERRFLWQL